MPFTMSFTQLELSFAIAKSAGAVYLGQIEILGDSEEGNEIKDR